MNAALKSIPADNLPEYVDDTERAIAALIVSELVASGYALSVWDGEAWTVKASQDAREVCAALASTEAAVIRVRDNAAKTAWPTACPTAPVVGDVTLIWGNGNALLSDWSSRAGIHGAEFNAAVESLADQITERYA